MTKEDIKVAALCGVMVWAGGFLVGVVAMGVYTEKQGATEADRVRAAALTRAETCETITNMGMKRWQEAVGVPLTQQVTCVPLREIAGVH